ncbi:MAG TPA: peptidoglycan DD-metalloendopeptidase family protein [Coleofasciculaceae cyanobacterium]
MTSAVLEAQMLPIFGASNPQVSPAPSAESQADAIPQADVAPAEVVVEVVTPEAIASPATTPADSAPANSPEVVSAPDPEPVFAPEANNLEPIAPEVSELEDQAAEAAAPESAVQTGEAKAPPQEPGNPPAANVNTTGQNSATPEKAERLAAARQAVSERLATLVNRDRLSKEAQLQQNLIALALYYAQLGEFEDARQVVRNPALSPEIQAATLAEIDQLALLAQPGAIASATNPKTTAAKPANPADASSTDPSAALATSAGADTLPPYGAPAGGYLTVPSTPELLQPYLSDRCLNSANVSFSDSGKASKSVQPRRTSPFLPIGQRVAAQLSVEKLKAQTVKPVAQAAPLQVLRTVKVSRIAPIASSNGSEIGKPLRNKVSANESVRGKTVKAIAPNVQPEQSALKIQVRSAQTQSIQTPSIQSPSIQPRSVQPRSVQTRQTASLPNFEANLPRLETRQSSLPQLIKLSRGATKIGANPHLNKSVKQTVNPAISPDASQTSGYWRTIAANCGGLESNRVTVDASSRMISSGMIFPLPIPVPLTSGFGWRIHPIRGDQRFHSGIDLGAPFGTPVLSALSGRVIAAEDMGGYGLAVIVEASSMRQQNLYAHLSAIAVKPGDWVEQGSVLGLVGSTGSSTGPHLHFETLLPSTEGWTAVDPLGAAMAASVAQVP